MTTPVPTPPPPPEPEHTLKFYWDFANQDPAKVKNGYWKTKFYGGIYWRLFAGYRSRGHRSHVFGNLHNWGDRNKSQLWNAKIRLNCKLYDPEGHVISTQKHALETNQRHFPRRSWKINTGANRVVGCVEVEVTIKHLEVKDYSEKPAEDVIDDHIRVFIMGRTLWIAKSLLSEMSPALGACATNEGFPECRENRIDLSHCGYEEVMALLNVQIYRRGVRSRMHMSLSELGKSYMCDRVLNCCSKWLQGNPPIPLINRFYIQDNVGDEKAVETLVRRSKLRQLKMCVKHKKFAVLSKKTQDVIKDAILSREWAQKKGAAAAKANAATREKQKRKMIEIEKEAVVPSKRQRLA